MAGQRCRRKRERERQKKVLEVGGWPCRRLCSKHSIRSQACFPGLNYWLHGNNKKDGVCFESSSFCPFLTQLGHPRIKRAKNKASGRTLLEVSPAQRRSRPWNSIGLSLRMGSPAGIRTQKPQGWPGWWHTGAETLLCTQLLMWCLWLGFSFIEILDSGAGHGDAHPWVGTVLALQEVGTAHPIVLRHQGAEELPGHALKARIPRTNPRGFSHWCLNFPIATLGRETAHADSQCTLHLTHGEVSSLSAKISSCIPRLLPLCSAARKPLTPCGSTATERQTGCFFIAFYVVLRHSLPFYPTVMTTDLSYQPHGRTGFPPGLQPPGAGMFTINHSACVRGDPVQRVWVGHPGHSWRCSGQCWVWPLSTKAVSSIWPFYISWGWFFLFETYAV